MTNLQRSAWPVFGHDWAVELLQSAIFGRENSRLAHAYLFLGASQVGKSTLARTAAAALLCTQGAGAPCGQCRSCRLMAHESHPDFRLVDPLDRDGKADRINGLLRVDQAAEIIHDAGLFPVEGRYKIFLLREMHLAHPSFANKLLKTLEEPSQQVLLFLTATERSRLLPTIVSRCQTIELRPVSPTAIEQALVQQWQAPTEKATLLARLAGGRLGWAVGRLDDGSMWERRSGILAELERLIQADLVDRLGFSAALTAQRQDEQLFDLLATWTGWWRDVLLVQLGCQENAVNIDYLPELNRVAAGVAGQTVQRYLYTLDRIEGYLHHTVNTRLALDTLLLQMPRVNKGLS